MPALPTDLRNKLERTIIEARDVAEAGAKAALEALAIQHHEPYPHQKAEQRKLRVQLRAHARQLGDMQDPKGELAISHLVHECAYEHWHRMLFARFLAENDLLIEPDSAIAVSLTEAEELAKAAKVDLWTYASRCAQQMLPQIFRPDDPVLRITLANEHRVKLERLLAGLAAGTFTTDDALGWVYQFWQRNEKERVNKSEEKITGDTLPAVTQLFTEHYMVLFLLHNTIGAWHAGKVLAANPKLAESASSEEELRRAVKLSAGGEYEFEYLRFARGADGKAGPWRPAPGMFGGWPKRAAEIKFLDPCCGSGHFLTAGFELLVRLRMAEDGLDLAHAVDAVLTDNLFGLELDARCTQIAAFNLALAAWKLAGHRKLPAMHIACTGIGPSGTMEEWVSFATKSSWRLPPIARPFVEDGLKGMHQLFSQAPTLGSLINPHHVGGTLITADYETLRPHLAEALSAELGDDLAHERAVAAAGMAKAAEILGDEYTLVATNVPYLGQSKQGLELRNHLEQFFTLGKAEMATAFVERCIQFCSKGGTTALVTPESWLSLGLWKKLREHLLKCKTWNVVAKLGPAAFSDMNWWRATTCLAIITNREPETESMMAGFDVSEPRRQADKAMLLRGEPLGVESKEIPCIATLLRQQDQRRNPDGRIAIGAQAQHGYLSEHAESYKGLSTGDCNRFIKLFWEVDAIESGWEYFQGGTIQDAIYGGREQILWWEEGTGLMTDSPACYVKGTKAWGHQGVIINQMAIRPTVYTGELFDENAAAIIPDDKAQLLAVWTYCQSQEYSESVRRIDSASKVTNRTLIKVPFDLVLWRDRASKEFPNGLPEPESDDPTQWLFHGRPDASTAPLQVAVARLLGYRWPAELDDKMRLSQRSRGLVAKVDTLLKFADVDGIVCIPAVRGEEPAADRLLALLSACGIKPDRNLDEWLRDAFFQEHCELFHHRPYVWHIWDGRKRDGFHALVNYHKLADGKKGRKLLESLTYSYLGEWITRQQDDVKRGAEGAEGRRDAAVELQNRLAAILEGEPPFDLFVRWKPLAEQPFGWEPDINDGVRVNIRPFLANDLPNGRAGAGVLRWKPNIKWDKDRGKEPERKKAEYPWFWGWDEKTMDFMGGKEFKGERFNGCHCTIAAKRAAREAAKKGGH